MLMQTFKKKLKKKKQEAIIEYKLNEKKCKSYCADHIIIIINYLIANTINQFKNVCMQSAVELVKGKITLFIFSWI